MRPVVLVHGAFHGPWCWDLVTPLLDAAGVLWVAPDLPSCARAADLCGFTEDAAAVRQALDALDGDEPAVLLGHSRGGRVISDAGDHPRVGHLVYLTASLPAPDIPPTMLPPGSEPRLPDLEAAPGRYYNECDPEIVSWALGRLRPQSWADRENAPAGQAWLLKPSTFVICELDQVINLERQRAMAAHASSVVEWPTGHSPFLSRPDLVASLLIELAGG